MPLAAAASAFRSDISRATPSVGRKGRDGKGGFSGEIGLGRRYGGPEHLYQHRNLAVDGKAAEDVHDAG